MINLTDREKRALFRLEQNTFSKVKNVIAVVSGKGGVGKSLVTSLLAAEMSKKGYKTAILDADITGPSVPKAFGLTEKLNFGDNGTEPALSKNGVKIVSTNLILDSSSSATVWRSPILTAAIRQFWQDIAWGDVDYMFVDLPPGTSDPQLTVFQSIPLMGIIMVTSPQDLVNMIVEKAMDMTDKLGIPVLGFIENYSYFTAPDTNKEYKIFGESKLDKIVAEKGLEILARLPIKEEFAKAVDNGQIEDLEDSYFDRAIERIIEFEKNGK